MADAARHYVEEKKLVYQVMVDMETGRSKKEKGEKILLEAVREKTGLSTAACSNALKWLKRKGLLETKDGKNGWYVKKISSATKKQLENRWCWRHGAFMLSRKKGKGQTEFFCPICERNRLAA